MRHDKPPPGCAATMSPGDAESGIALHTMIVGQPYRLRMLRGALQHIVSHPERDKVWFTRPSAIYDHCAALPASKFPPAQGLFS